MFKNMIKYLKSTEYEDFVDDMELRGVGRCTGKNIFVTHEYKNVELVNFMFKELGVNKIISDEYEVNYDALYDVLKEIPERSSKDVRFLQLLIEDENYINERMFKVLKNIQKYFAEEIIECGSEDSFPLSFDIYIKN